MKPMTFMGVTIHFDDVVDANTVWLVPTDRRTLDAIYQAMHNNLWDNHPFELDRWADDGGR